MCDEVTLVSELGFGGPLFEFFLDFLYPEMQNRPDGLGDARRGAVVELKELEIVFVDLDVDTNERIGRRTGHLFKLRVGALKMGWNGEA